MALIDRALGRAGPVEALGEAAEGLSEVFVPNATRSMELAADIHQATLATAAAEFQYAGDGWFDRMINGINRLPRPFLALGTLGLFVYAMVDPGAFADRMIGLQEVPEPLWWLLGAIVSFYFGARELHYARTPTQGRAAAGRRRLRDRLGGIFGRRRRQAAGDPAPDNPALSDWRSDD
ncbi:holin family protein [Hasllibacter sp. MH4015]|uniref:holin family protein n=1 Tax=Hasllibacter sp. MH4015 TaxID=2854029 RepID=UPI001CD6F6AD|nr:holin family protein [Hasllibacter sp. MH4015]